MILCLFLFILIFSPSLSQSNDCSKCLYGCESGTNVCVNSTCISCIFSNCSQYYGNTCNQKAPSAPKSFSIQFFNNTNPSGSCNGTASILPFNTSASFPSISPTNYYLVYGTDSSLGNSDPNLNSNSHILLTFNNNAKTYDTMLQFIEIGFYRFASYFTFEDINLYGKFNSSISPAERIFINMSNCRAIPTTTTISPSTTTTTTTTTTQPPTTITPSNYSVQSVVIKPNFTSIFVQWSPPKLTTGLLNYAVSIDSGNPVNVNLNTSYNFANLNEDKQYNIKITSTYAILSFDTQSSTKTLKSNPPINLSWNKDYTFGIVYWNLTQISADYYFTISVNNTKSGSVNLNVYQYNVTNLNESGCYSITVAVYYYGGSEVSNSIIVWTKPAKFINPISLPTITNITSKTFQVLFPIYSNYKGDINLFYILLQSSTTTSRRKREVLSCQAVIPGIPSSATIRFANTSNNNNQTILIGSGTPYSPYNCNNDYLSGNTNYTVFAVIGSLVNGTGEYIYSTTTFRTTSDGLSPGAIVGIIIGVLLFLIILIILIILFLKYSKKEKNYSGFKEPYEDLRPQSYLYWSNITDRMEARKIIIDEKKIFEGLNFKDEYENLPTHLCNEHYGVELGHLNHCLDHTGDHIINHGLENTHYTACFVDGYIKKKAYLCLQSPFDKNSISDFWLMIYTENVGQIVMITVEGELIKTNKYWPEQTAEYDEIEVSLVDEINYAYFTIRTFDINKKDSKTHFKVNQYHYWKWPANDHLVNIASFLEFHEVIKRSENLIYGATTVHSQLGCTLNGLYIGFDILNEQLHTVDAVNVYKEFGQLRRYRQNMNININQYMTVHDLLFESYLSRQFVVDLKFKKLMNSSTSTFHNFLDRQFLLLKKFYNLFLSSQIRHEKNYIFDSVECSQSIMLSNFPSPFIEESIALWDMIFINNINVIVDLYNRDLNEMFYISQNLPNIEILNKTSEKHKNHVNCVKITVKKLNSNDIRNLVIYSINSQQKLEYNIGVYSSWIELISNIIHRPKENLLVFNTDKSFISTVFLVCLNAATKLLYSKFVSVYYTIRSLQSSGHPIINEFEEFKYIFEFLEKWINKKMSKYEFDPDFSFHLELNQEKSLEKGAYNRLYPNLDNLTFSPNKSFNKYSTNVYDTQ